MKTERTLNGLVAKVPMDEVFEMHEAGRPPLEGVRVLEICHAVMGPACGLVLADMAPRCTRWSDPVRGMIPAG